jgi:fructokinase
METALIVGESLVDVVHHADGRVAEHAGGSPANVAVALSRLGRATTLVTQYAEDRLGAVLDAHLRAEGVDVARQDPTSGRTSSADARLGDDGSATYEFDLDWSIEPWRPERPPLVVHTGSLGAVLAPGARSVLAMLDAAQPHATITYDLNIRPGAMGPLDDVRRTALALAARADVVKASDEDLHHLFPDVDEVSAARELLEHGPAAVVITRGGEGATALTASHQVDVRAPRVVVADTIGAGDSFCAAVIDELWTLGALGGAARDTLHALRVDGWRRVLEHAVAVAAVTVTRPGADPPRRGDLP